MTTGSPALDALLAFAEQDVAAGRIREALGNILAAALIFGQQQPPADGAGFADSVARVMQQVLESFHRHYGSAAWSLEHPPARAGEALDARCTFCGKVSDEVSGLVVGTGAAICAECIDLCAEIVSSDSDKT